MREVQYPMMRAELIEHLNALSDIDYQRRIWVLGGSNNSIVHDEFDYAVHFLYDDTQLASNPSSMIGVVLRDTSEVVKISKLVEAIEVIFKQYGTKLPDAEYIQLPEWSAVLEAAREAVNLIQ